MNTPTGQRTASVHAEVVVGNEIPATRPVQDKILAHDLNLVRRVPDKVHELDGVPLILEHRH